MNGTTDNDPLEGRTNTRNSNNNSSSGSNSAINPNNSDSSNSVNRLSFSFSTTGNRLGLPTDSSTQKVGLIPARLSIGSIPRPGIPSVNSDNSNNDFNSIRRDDTAQGMRINRNITSNDSSNRGVPTLSYKSQLLSQSSFLSTNNQTRGKSILTGSSNLWGKGSSSLLRPSLFPGALSTSMQSVERHLKVDGASAIHQDYSTTSSEQKRKIDLNYSEEEQTIDSNDDSQEQDEEENDDGDDMEKEEAMQETIEGSQEMEVVTGQAVKSTAVLAEIEASNLITSPSQAVDTQIKANSRVYYYDSLSLEGFQALKKYLSLVTRDVGGYLIVPDLDDRTTEVKTNERKKGFKYTVPCFTYTDKPMVGWCKEISVALHGKSKGRTKVRYRSPIEGKSISSKVELQNYLSSSGRSIDLMTYFDFRENFCVCHVPEDKREPFIKCSYGLAGCNGWVHTYCIGLGRLTPRQIDDHLDVVCPYCTVYLEEIDQKSLFGENTLFIRDLFIERPRVETNINWMVVQASRYPHLAWGLIGKKTYKLKDGDGNAVDEEKEKGVSMLPNSPASQQNLNMLGKFQDGSEKFQGGHTAALVVEEKNSVSAAKEANSNVKESNSNSISPSDSKAQLMLQSDVDSDSDGNFDEKISSRWANKFEMNTLDNESVGSPANASQVSPDKLTVQHEESSDDSVQEKKKRKPLPSKSLEFILKHKVFQQFESKKIVTEEIDNVSPARLIQAITPTSKDVGSGSKLIPELGNSDDDGDDDETDSLVSSDSDVLDYEDVLFADEVKATNSNAYFADYNGRRTAVGVTGGWMETQPKKRKIRSKEERIADSVRQNFKELKDPYQSLNTKKKNALLQEAVSVVPNHNYKKKKGHRFTDMLSKFHAKPTLAYVPSLDGGVYFTALAHANVPRSYYELCSAKFLCGFCMCFFSKNRKAIDEDDILRLSFSTAERKRKLNANKKARTIDPYTAIIDEYVGVVKMPLHYRCAYTLNKKTYQDYSKNGNASGIRIKSIHEYQYADDIACDLCGRQGGIIARFSISKGVSTRVTPRENGWYGHLPCIHFLRQSNFLLRDTTLARNSSYCYGYPKLTNQHRYDNPIREEVEKRMSAMGMISERPDERTQLLMEETNEELPEETDTPEKPLFSTSISIVPTEVTALMDELIGEVAERHEIRAVLDAIIDEVVSSTEEDDAMEETEDKDEGAKEADEDSVSDTSSDSESYRTIDRSIPLCRFDVVMDKYRCTLCGQHNGLVLRCAARNCLIRAHPLCAQLQENEFYSLRFLQEEKESCDVAHNTNIGIVFLCCLHGVNLHRT